MIMKQFVLVYISNHFCRKTSPKDETKMFLPYSIHPIKSERSDSYGRYAMPDILLIDERFAFTTARNF